MQEIIKNNLEKIKLLCSKNSVESLYLFGSATSSHFNETSDIDMVITPTKNTNGDTLESFDYFDIWFALQNIFNRKVDLVINDAIRNPYFKKVLKKQNNLYMKKDIRAYYDDILFSIERIKLHLIQTTTFNEFKNNYTVYDAVERRLSIIGEALWQANKIDNELLITDKAKIIGLRHILTHVKI